MHKAQHPNGRSNLNSAVGCDEEFSIGIFQVSIQHPAQDHQVERLADGRQELLDGGRHLAVAVVKEPVKLRDEGSALKLAASSNDCCEKLQPKK